MLVVFLKCQMILGCLYLQFTVTLPVTLAESVDLVGSSCLHMSTPWDQGQGKKRPVRKRGLKLVSPVNSLVIEVLSVISLIWSRAKDR